MNLNQIRQVALCVPDLEASIRFFEEKLGASLVAQFGDEYVPLGIAFFEFGGVRVLLEAEASPSTLYFSVDDVEQSYKTLQEKGVEFVGPPEAIFYDESGTFGPAGETEYMAFINDPGGDTLAISSRETR